MSYSRILNHGSGRDAALKRRSDAMRRVPGTEPKAEPQPSPEKQPADQKAGEQPSEYRRGSHSALMGKPS